ncbi:MAG: DUF1844 domain-containing protein [Actinomycetota bacterium]|nr:DUF1844 domain-containing protein [Actinomycetota bacterium]
MSTLWTPGGERPVGRPEPTPPSPPPPPAPGASAAGPAGASPAGGEEELEARMAELRQQLAETPAELVVANHCYGLFELAALHLSLQPPQLPQAQLAIDALGAILEGLAGRLGQEEQQLREALAQLRLAYVQIRAGGGEGGAAG